MTTTYDLPDDVKEQLGILTMNRGETPKEDNTFKLGVAAAYTAGGAGTRQELLSNGTSDSTATTGQTSPSSGLVKKPRLYVAGPYSGKSLQDVEYNVRLAVEWGNIFWGHGFIPFVPHLTHFWEQQIAHPYEDWLELDIAWLEKCDAMFVIAESPGVLGEIKFCRDHGIPVFRREEDVLTWRDKVWQHPVWMNEKPLGDPRFHKLLHEIGALHDERQAKYGSDQDPFANVRATELFGMPGYVGALVRAQDKMRRLANMVSGRIGELVEDPTRDAFLDLAVYSLIGLILWEEDNAKDHS